MNAASEERDDPLETVAVQWQDQWETGHPAAGPASRFCWNLETSYPIDRIRDRTRTQWRVWMDREIRMWAREGDPERFDDELRNPIREPVVVVEMEGRAYVWDGNHRIGGSVVADRMVVPAIVGRPRMDMPDDAVS